MRRKKVHQIDIFTKYIFYFMKEFFLYSYRKVVSMIPKITGFSAWDTFQSKKNAIQCNTMVPTVCIVHILEVSSCERLVNLTKICKILFIIIACKKYSICFKINRSFSMSCFSMLKKAIQCNSMTILLHANVHKLGDR